MNLCAARREMEVLNYQRYPLISGVDSKTTTFANSLLFCKLHFTPTLSLHNEDTVYLFGENAIARISSRSFWIAKWNT